MDTYLLLEKLCYKLILLKDLIVNFILTIVLSFMLNKVII